MYLLKSLFINWQKKIVILEYVRYACMWIVSAVSFNHKYTCYKDKPIRAKSRAIKETSKSYCDQIQIKK